MEWALGRHEPTLTRRIWRIDRRWALAATVGLFPGLFFIDEGLDTTFSPVLPGLAVLLLLWLLSPYVAMELRARRGKAPDERGTERSDISSKYGLGIAATWFILWLVFG